MLELRVSYDSNSFADSAWLSHFIVVSWLVIYTFWFLSFLKSGTSAYKNVQYGRKDS